MSYGTSDAELGEIQRRLAILRIGLLLVVVLLGVRLWYLQVRDGVYYRDLSENNRTRTVLLEPARASSMTVTACCWPTTSPASPCTSRWKTSRTGPSWRRA